MTNDDLTLRDVARAVLNKHDVSGRQLDAYARNRGLTISYTTINAMAAGAYRSRPSRKTLDALVALSELPESVVYRAAGVPAPVRSLADDLPPDADTLTELQRDAVLAVVRQFAEANRAVARLGRENDRGNTAPKTDAGETPAIDLVWPRDRAEFGNLVDQGIDVQHISIDLQSGSVTDMLEYLQEWERVTGAESGPQQEDYPKAAQSTGPKTRANRARRRAEKERIPGERQGEAPEGGA